MDVEEARLRAALAKLKADMEANGHGRDGPVRTTSALMGDRWSSLILVVLEMGEWRYAELHRSLSRLSHEGAISQRMLTLKLRSLEREGFVARQVIDDVPPKVSYRLTPMGLELATRVRALIAWVASRRHTITQARARFDSAN